MKNSAHRRNSFFLLLTIVLVIVVAACTIPKENTLYEIHSFRYPHFEDDMRYDGLEQSILQSIAYLQRVPPDRQFTFGKDSYSADHLMQSLEKFLAYIQTSPSQKALRKFIQANYRVYRSIGSGWSKEVLYTGYYEPSYMGKLEKSADYSVPVLGRPSDLIRIDLSSFAEKYAGESITGRIEDHTVVPYYDRREIEDGALDGNAPVLAWLKDPVDLFFLQIQGSGKIYLDNGEFLNVHYDGSNGRPYRSIGKLLIDEGKIPKSEMSMQAIRSYIENHPDEMAKILFYNPSYVFFKLEEDGPLGYLEVKLTPGRSLALDRRLFPLPALAFIETQKPLVDGYGQITEWEEFSRFVLSQDTGGAIRGPARADMFWGSGNYAEIAAGHMQHRGKLYLLVLKPNKDMPQ
jgi:membrane-bound lytic murein transglycosylase A